MQRPTSSAEFAKQSNWYVVGQMYADRLDLAGLPQKADGVRAQLFNASRFADKND